MENHQGIWGGYVDVVRGLYWCRICAKFFDSKAKAREHCRSTTKHVWCDECERIFVSAESLEDHRRHAIVHQHICKDCQRAFPSTQALRQHYEYSSAHHICFYCDNWPDFHAVSSLDDHLLKVHFYCFDCGTTRASQYALNEHAVAEHHGCEICFKTFWSDGARKVNQHMKTHDERVYRCKTCHTRAFTNFSHLLLHLERSLCGPYNRVKLMSLELPSRRDFYDARKIQPWCCKNCNRSFESPSALFAHSNDSQVCKNLLEEGQCLAVLKAHLMRHFVTQSGPPRANQSR
ncbi:hypothetical protein N7468_001884 [Penicillium chermesinum]|uniref:C2H2-type domain-containing protein n=1 Tax=Penicillium chermesinum TaxID=63820 RepID=A0A9W9PHE9_9EURO|nr:uncharacterized protein N7468_001884 [Penicillium chermesinum]KAJ5246901.1 hypothetical protein N7468_001884 [Penicillium chermesinum]KAJ6145157.1 hypothetical protein N7470_009052 [Penicillium chermesinum]